MMGLLKDHIERHPNPNGPFAKKSFLIASRIREILEEKGMNKSDFAKMLAITEREVESIIGGSFDFTLTMITRIECALGVELVTVDMDVILKACKWDALDSKISECYCNEEGEYDVENPVIEGADLATVGEMAASAFGWV